MTDKVNRPAHYTQGPIECIDVIEQVTRDMIGMEAVCTAKIIKYMWRWKDKNGVEDLRKAQYYINRLIAAKEKAEALERYWT